MLDQGHDVAHAEDAARVAFGVEHFQAVDFFGCAREFDGRAGDLPHRQRRAAARVAVHLGEHDAGERQRLAEGFGGVGGVLALHGIDHEQSFHGLEGGVQGFDFLHQRFVNGQAACGVHQQHVVVLAAGVVQGGAGDVQRLLIGRGREPVGAGLRRHGFELLDGGGAVHVARDGEYFFLALLDQVARQFGRGGGFARALQAGHEDDGGRLRGQVDVAHAFAHGGGQLAIDDAHQRLAGLEAAQHFLAQRFFFHAGDEVAHHGQGHVGFQQGHAHFAQHVGHVAFGDAGLAADVLDQAREFFGKGGGHVRKGDGKGRWNAARTRAVGKSRTRRERRAKRAAAVAKA